MNLKERAKKLKSDIPTVFLTMKDEETPVIAKVFAAMTVAYALSPIDFIPDDVLLLPALIALTIKLIPKEVWEKNRRLAEHLWENGRPKKWYYSIPILLFWALLLFPVVKAVWL